MEQVFQLIIDILAYTAIGAVAAWYFFYYRRRDLLGGFWAAVAIGTIGAVIFNALATPGNWFVELVNFLMYPKTDWFEVRINLIVALGGAFIIIKIFNHINHDKERR